MSHDWKKDMPEDVLQDMERLNKEYHVFAEVIDPAAMRQFADAMADEAIIKGAIMPDVHKGYSLPIGSVVASGDKIFPAFVGYDIGCGMCALRLGGVDRDDIEANRDAIFDGIYQDVPVGTRIHNKSNLDGNCNLKLSDLTPESRKVAIARNWSNQLGTLGGGNHFIEVGYDEKDQVWIVIHSGSRGTGHGIASNYMRLASGTEKPLEGNFGFEVESAAGRDYINDLAWGLQYALDNRSAMIANVVNVIHNKTKKSVHGYWDELINRNHNHATLRVVDGQDMWIHRKGATHAEEGMDGVIPGNMRDGSFIVRGKGNPDSLYSSSHGAGRILGRNQARKTLDVADFEKEMRGVKAKVGESTLDESPFAYKSIFEVMDNQKQLVDVVAHVRPIVNIKG